MLVDGGSIGEDTRISVEEFDEILEESVSAGAGSPRSNAKEIEGQRGRDGRVDRNSDGELSLDVHKVRDIEFVIIDKGRGPGIGGGDGSDGDKSGRQRIEDLKEPRGTSSGNSEVHLDRVSTHQLEIVAISGSLEIV